MIVVSILIPTFNQCEFILKAVNSALSQSYPHKEVIICDDSDNDLTHSILKPLISSGSIQYYKNSQTLGRLENYRNLLYAKAQGEWVLMMDGDDYLINERYIAECVDLVMKNKDVVLVKAQHAINNLPQRHLTNHKKIKILPPGYYIKRPISFLINFSHLTSFYNREKAMQCKFYQHNDTHGFLELSFLGKVINLYQYKGIWRTTGLNESLKFCTTAIQASLYFPENRISVLTKSVQRKFIFKIKFYYLYNFYFLYLYEKRRLNISLKTFISYFFNNPFLLNILIIVLRITPTILLRKSGKYLFGIIDEL